MLQVRQRNSLIAQAHLRRLAHLLPARYPLARFPMMAMRQLRAVLEDQRYPPTLATGRPRAALEDQLHPHPPALAIEQPRAALEDQRYRLARFLTPLREASEPL